jgi:hypothetical protein
MYGKRDAGHSCRKFKWRMAAFAVKRFFFQSGRNHQANETRQNENRDIGNKNGRK